MNEYQQQIIDHYQKPMNFGVPSWLPTSSKKVTNVTCGDEIEVFLKVNDTKIEAIAFNGQGCSISIASASLLTERFKNNSIDYIMNFSEKDLNELLGITLTPTRQNCANLALEAIKEAIKSV